ncbi:PQQ-binding-like beta-propeller repeat protein [candidate division WOR-3 bacterium]|nr:PQQ-binding-like beta-propeller repeat protein [candidate division WOR-3 bacterium]
MKLRKLFIVIFIISILSCVRHTEVDTKKYSATLEGCEHYMVESTNESILSADISSIAMDRNGDLWVGSRNGFSQLKDGKWHNHFYFNCTPRVEDDYNGDIWILMKDQILRILNDSIFVFKQDSVNCNYTSMEKEKNGRLWFSTRGKGIFSYYNNKWEHYTAKDNLPCDSVTSIVYDSKNKKVWIGTKKGMAYFKNGKWYSKELVYDESYKVLKITKEESKTHCYGEIDTIAKNNGFPQIKKIKIDKHGIIWLLTRSNSIWRYGGKRWKLYARVYNIKYINDFVVDSKINVLYLATSSGTYRLKGNTVEKIQSIHNAWALSLDQKDNLWIGTYAKGLLKLNLRDLEYSAELPKGGILSNFVSSLFIDDKDNVYVATNKGLSSFDGEKWSSFDIDTNVFSVTGGNDYNIWIVTSNGIKSVNNNEIRSIPWPFKNPYWSYAVVALDSEGTMYIAGGLNSEGIYRYKNAKWSIFNTDSGLPNNDVTSILIDSKNRKWFGTKNGLMMIKDSKIKVYSTDNGLVGNKVTAITEDIQGNLWVGTLRGLSKFDGHCFINSLNNQNVTAVVKGNYNDIWMGVENGCLWRIDINTYPQKESFTPYPKRDEILHVSSIKLDGKGNVWVGNIFNGVQKFLFNYKRLCGKRQKKVDITQGKKAKTIKPVTSLKPSSNEGGWTAMFHDFGRTNSSFNQKIKPPLALDWKIGVGPISYSFPMHSTPLLNKGRLYVVDHKGNLWCIDALTGQRLCKTEIGSQNMNKPIPMVIMNGEIIVQGDDNNLNFISCKDGKRKDELNITLTDMIVKEDLIYGIAKDEIVIIYPHRRKIVDRIPCKGCEFISCNDEYFVVLGRSLTVFSFKNNKKLWEDPNKRSTDTHPMVYKDRIICIAPIIDCYNLKTGKILWRTKMKGKKISPAAVWGEKLYIQRADADNLVNLICFDALNGNFVWEKVLDKPEGFTAFACYSFPPVVCNGIVFATVTPKVYALDAETGENIWTKEICGYVIAPLVFGSEKMYITAIGEMYSYKTLKPGKYAHRVRKKEIPEDEKENMIAEIELKIKDVKKKSSPKVQGWIDELHKLTFKGYRSYSECIRCHRLMDSLAAHNQVEVISLLIEKESLTSWTIDSTENFVMTTLKNALNAHPEFGKTLYLYLLKYTQQDTNLTLKKKAILLLGHIDDRRAVKTLKDLLSDYAVVRDVVKALCTSPNDLSYSILGKILNDESMNKCWRQIAMDIADYKKDERVKWMLEGLLKSEWSDSLTKVYAEKGLKKLEEEKLKGRNLPSSVTPHIPQKERKSIESLTRSEIEIVVKAYFQKGDFTKTYQLAKEGLMKYPQSSSLMYYKCITAYKIGEINIAIETLISLIEKFPSYPCDENIRKILTQEVLRRTKYKDKRGIIHKYLEK